MADMQLRELRPEFGAEITGLEPAAALADEALQQQLQELFDSRGILVFRDLDIDLAGQANLVRMLIRQGPLAQGESATGRDGGKAFYVSNKEDGGGAPFGRLLFHSDMMWSDHTFQVLSLYGAMVEQPATPTIFVSAHGRMGDAPAGSALQGRRSLGSAGPRGGRPGERPRRSGLKL